MRTNYIYHPYGPDSDRYHIHILTIELGYGGRDKTGLPGVFSLAIIGGKGEDWWRLKKSQEPSERVIQMTLIRIGRRPIKRLSDVEHIAMSWLKKKRIDRTYVEIAKVDGYYTTVIWKDGLEFAKPKWVLVHAYVDEILYREDGSFGGKIPTRKYYLVALPQDCNTKLARDVTADYIIKNNERFMEGMGTRYEIHRIVIPQQPPIIDFVDPWIYDNRLMWKRVVTQLKEIDEKFHTNFLENELYWEAQSEIISTIDREEKEESKREEQRTRT